MRVAFDSQVFEVQSYGGISRYYTSLARELAVQGTATPRVFAPLHVTRFLRTLPPSLVDGRFTATPLQGRAGRLHVAYNRLWGRARMGAWRPDVVHETYFSATRTSARGTPTVVTVFDMIHELFPAGFAAGDRTAAAKAAAVRRADHVICISHSTRADLIRILDVPPEKVTVTHLAADDVQAALPAGGPVAANGGAPILLYVGARAGYKNFMALLEAYAASPRLRRDSRLVCFGGGPFSPEEQQAIQRLGVADRVTQVGGDDDALDALYRSARVFVYPSLYEGFGLPLLEAMARGCPVVAADTSSIPEVAGDAAVLFDPLDRDAMRASIERVVHDDALRADLAARGVVRAAGFTWGRCAAETAVVYRQVTG